MQDSISAPPLCRVNLVISFSVYACCSQRFLACLAFTAASFLLLLFVHFTFFLRSSTHGPVQTSRNYLLEFARRIVSVVDQTTTTTATMITIMRTRVMALWLSISRCARAQCRLIMVGQQRVNHSTLCSDIYLSNA